MRALFKEYDTQLDRRKEVVEKIRKQLFPNIQFNHSKPAKIQGAGGLQVEESTQKKSVLETIDVGRYYDEAYLSIEGLYKISHNYIGKLDLKRLAESPY